MRIGRLCLAVALATGLALAATPASAQAPPTTDPAAACKKVQPSVVFVGTATTIVDDTVTFSVTDVRTGEGRSGTSVDVRYPTEFNARKLVVGTSYRVAATSKQDQLSSIVPTAQDSACGQSTRFASGAAIDTGALVGVKAQGPALIKKVGLGVLGTLVLLVLLGRVFDRRSRYR